MSTVHVGWPKPTNKDRTGWILYQAHGEFVHFSVDSNERWAIKNLIKAARNIVKSEVKIKNGKLLRFRAPYTPEQL